MAMRRDDYPIFTGEAFRDIKVKVNIHLGNNTNVQFGKVVKKGENAIEYVINELNDRGYQNDFIEGQAHIEGMSNNHYECVMDIIYNNKWILMGTREIRLVQQVVYYPFECRGVAYEDVLKPRNSFS